MNCANHSDQAALAFCRTCGKPLCNQCTRDVHGVIYCESCLAARMEGASAAPGSPYTPPPQSSAYGPIAGPSAYVPPILPGAPISSGPNPTVAGILGAIPFGVGAVYCGQYVKGLIYLGIFVLTIIAQSQDIPGIAHAAVGIFQGFFWIYQIIDAVRTARAIQLGEPAPDPFGLVSMFGAGPSPSPATGVPSEKTETRVPIAAVILIGLGVLFLINTAFDFSLHRYWPLILIVLGAYLFAKHWGLLGAYQRGCVCERCRTRKLMGPALLVTIGILFLLENVSRIDFGKTWPAILLVVGVVRLMQSNASYTGHVGSLTPDSGYPPTPPPPTTFQERPPNPPAPPSESVDPSSGEVKNV